MGKSTKPAQPKPESEPWLDIHEAAAHLGCHTKTLYNWAKTRQIAYSQRRPKAPLMFQRSELDRFRSRGMVPARKEPA